MRVYIIYNIFMLFTHLNIVDHIYTHYIHSINVTVMNILLDDGSWGWDPGIQAS